jgi:S1-C subfamily serine protease
VRARPLVPILVVAIAALAGAARSRGGDVKTPVPLDETLRRVIARVGPGVVRIEVDGGDRSIPTPERRLFHDPETQVREGGAGVVLRKDGLVLTHAAIVAYAVPRIEVLTGDGRRLPATVVARDPKLDIALLKADVGSETLVPVTLGSTAGLEPGRLVVAFGNPFGVARDSRASASLGVVSSLGPLDAPEAVWKGDVVVTDAAVNPGNDGGPLVDLDGNVLGILAPLVRDRRTRSVVGFAIPIDAIAPRLDALARGSAPPHVGVLVGERAGSLVVERVVPGSPADKAGVREGDKLVSLEGAPLATKEDLRHALEKRKPGARVTLVVERDAKSLELPVELGEESER